jgi:NarL family two-component system response regulator LiaR
MEEPRNAPSERDERRPSGDEPEPKIRVLLFDHPLCRAGVRAFLELEADIEVVGEAGSIGEALEQVRLLRPYVVVMEGLMEGHRLLDAIGPLKRDCPVTRVLVLTGYSTDDLALAALTAGADGFVAKQSARDELPEALRRVHRGEGCFSAPLVARLARTVERAEQRLAEDVSRRLSGRELEVLQLLSRGDANQKIAETLCVAPSTVAKHVTQILAKLGLSNRTEAALYALRRGITNPDDE